MPNQQPPPIEIRRQEVGWRLSSEQWVPLSADEVFPFFGTATNLEQLTPEFLRFRILRSTQDTVGQGTLIDYRLQLHGFPVWWRTRIEEWDPPRGFVDVQIRGPFRRWHHRHEFVPERSGTLARDVVDFDLYCRGLYSTPLLGWIDTDLRRIFTYRQAAIAKVFGRERCDREVSSSA